MRNLLRSPLLARLGPYALLAAAVLAVYAQTAGFDFTSWDDPNYITENYRVLAGLSWSGVGWAFTTTQFSNWHPLTWISHMAAWSAFGPWAGGHHLVNVALHVANTLLCFTFFRAATGAPWRSLLLALLFAVHPLHVETVAWLADRKALLAALFWWLALLAWLGWAQRGSRRAYWLAIVCHALALLAKPMAVSLPLVLLALDVWPLRRLHAATGGPILWWPRLREKLPFFALALAAAVVTYYAQDHGGAVVSDDYLPLPDRLANAFVVYQDYLQHLLWPTGLAFFYTYPLTWPVWRVGLALVVFAVLAYVAVIERERRPWWLAGWLWFTAMLLPVIGIVQVGSQSHADRYMYLTSVGFFMAVLWSLPRPTGRWRLLAGAAAVGLVALLALGAHRHAAVWRDSETLFRSALEVDGQNYVAHLVLSERLVEKNTAAAVEAARRHVSLALELSDGFAIQMYGNRVLGRVAYFEGRYDEARQYLQRSLSMLPNSPKVRYYLAQVDLAEGRWTSAERWLQGALALRREYPEVLELLAEQYALRGDLGGAIRYQRAAVALRPWLLGPRLSLAGLCESAGDFGTARGLYREVLGRWPGQPVALAALTRLEVPDGR